MVGNISYLSSTKSVFVRKS